MGTKLNLDRVVYPPLTPGLYDIKILSVSIKTDVNDNEYLQVKFAPTDKLDHIHTEGIFVSDKYDGVAAFIGGVKAYHPELLEESSSALIIGGKLTGLVIPASLVCNTTVTAKGEVRKYRNWYFGKKETVFETGHTTATATALPSSTACEL